jgi:non-specific serine/threonine protein kinase
METLVDELQAGVGLGGRSRTTASPTERARLNVTRAIRTAVQKIGAHNRPLADHLRRSVKTGLFCAYDPDPQARIEWEL